MKTIAYLLPAIGLLLSGSIQAGQYVFPAKGQSAEQQQKDEYSCHQWATQQTGYDPTRAAQASTAPVQAEAGSGARGALRGAGRGWIIGEIADGDSGDAALAGAVIGGIRGRHQSRQQQQAAQTSAQSALQQDYLRAKSACLEAKGYTVK